jgi:hypothetical protein
MQAISMKTAAIGNHQILTGQFQEAVIQKRKN